MSETETGSRDAVLERIVEELMLRGGRIGHPLRVGLDGRSTAGKSHLADELVRLLRQAGREALRVSIDEFHRKGHKGRSERGEWTPETRVAEDLDHETFKRWVLGPLGPGGSRRIRPRMLDSYHDEFWPEEWVEVGDEAIVISDAGHGFGPQLVDHWDYRIWVEISAETMVRRASERDIRWAGTPEEVRSRYEHFWVPTDRYYQETFDPVGRAHCVIDNNDFDRPVILRI